MEHNIEITRTLNATHEVKDPGNGITANVRVADGSRIESVENGILSDESGNASATFNSWGDQSLHVTYNTAEGRTASLSKIESFLNALRAKFQNI